MIPNGQTCSDRENPFWEKQKLHWLQWFLIVPKSHRIVIVFDVFLKLQLKVFHNRRLDFLVQGLSPTLLFSGELLGLRVFTFVACVGILIVRENENTVVENFEYLQSNSYFSTTTSFICSMKVEMRSVYFSFFWEVFLGNTIYSLIALEPW